jgi:hypothetical protein
MGYSFLSTPPVGDAIFLQIVKTISPGPSASAAVSRRQPPSGRVRLWVLISMRVEQISVPGPRLS